MVEDIMMYVLLLVGFVLLIKGADFFVEGSSAVARKLRVPSVVIGLTIVAMGTSAPEAAVSITAGLAGSNEIALSNVVGSNLFNTLVVIGVCALMSPFITNPDILKRDLPVNFAVTAVLLLLVSWNRKLDRIDAGILLVIFVTYLVLVVRNAMKNRIEGEDKPEKELAVWQMVVFIIGGIAAIVAGGDLVVDSASAIAKTFGMSDTLVGLTIVAVGTSLPELVTSIVASRKGESGLALGNAVGSNIFNVLFILGLSGVLSPIAAEFINVIDIVIALGVAAVIYFFGFTRKKMARAEGAVCVLLYVVYMAYAIMR